MCHIYMEQIATFLDESCTSLQFFALVSMITAHRGKDQERDTCKYVIINSREQIFSIPCEST